ncbi:hypothetical protein [Shewanella sp. GutDb-MelDb]|uniref:hypothetical protein n=1 Tax=Shewanella sp. GutDb-MelDb TaxID=2058316 RepID=UPI000C7C2692|nr:hypothetical protein [Shewanella sp. GutDb-MelDb]PKG56435.1 hypothetical protein CXF82_14715 [Shewanella sp. GutDb-MelDb]
MNSSKFSNHVKIVLLLLLFVVYVCLELSLNILLIDMYAQPIQAVFGEHRITAERLELFGRTLSGFGLALAVATFIPATLFNRLIRDETKKVEAGKTLDPKTAQLINGVFRPLILVLVWALIIPCLRIAVDGVVDTTSNDKKLSAVRAIVYKEAYLAETVAIEGFPEFDDIVSDPKRKDLMVALIPSLAYFSAGFNKLIESNLENMADQFLLNRQEVAFITEAIPRIRQFDRTYKQELARYQKANKAYLVALKKENNYSLIEQERVALLNQANDSITNHWKSYSQALLDADNYRKDVAEDANNPIRKGYSSVKDDYFSSSCKSACRQQLKVDFAKYLSTLKYDTGESFGVYLTADDITVAKMLKSKYYLMSMFERGRIKYIHRLYGIPEEMEYEQYNDSPQALTVAVDVFNKQGVKVANDWTLSDQRGLHQAIEAKYKGRAKALWNEYRKNARFSVAKPRLDRVGFARLPQVTKYAKKTLGNYYLAEFTPSISERKYKKLWLAKQDNISFIKMVTSTAATAAFSPGGSMFMLGKDAVKLAVIPPMSIAASLLAIFLLFIKLGVYLWSKSKSYLTLAMLAGAIAFGVPVGASVTDKNAYHVMMGNFAEAFSTVDPFDRFFTLGFGYVLDVENGIFQTYRDLSVVRLVGQIIKYRPPYQPQESNQPVETIALEHEQYFLRAYDDLAYAWLSFLPKHYGFGEVIKPFDTNITVLKQDMNVGAYIGVRLENEKVAAVNMPNFLQNSDIGLLAEQKFFYKPDVVGLVSEFASNFDDPQYWLQLGQGDVGKESLIQKLEVNMTAYLNHQPSTLSLLNTLHKKGQNNLILLELKRTKKYRCFVLGVVDAQMISDSINVNFFDYEELPKCKAVL